MSAVDGDVAPTHTDSKQHTLTAEDILENLSGLRILPEAIKTENEGQESGGQGEVARAILKRGHGQRERVAVKKLRYGDNYDDEKFSKSFVNEVDILARLSHPNIVKLLGFIEDLENDDARLIFAWEENGNVQQFLAKRKCHVPERVSLVKDVTAGLEYLHTRQPPICHGDLKSLNILVNSSCRGVITDFGSARVLRKRSESKADRERVKPEASVPSRAGDSISSQISISVTGNQLTITGPKWSFRWAAPEIIMLDAVPDLPSDIWAIGWVIWEIITDKLPFHELSSDVAITKTFVEETDPSVGNDAQMSQIESLCALMRDCLSYDPISRPTAAKCCTLVKWMPSTVPTSEMRPDLKDRSTTLLLSSGYMRYSQNDYTAAAALFNKALASAKSENDALSAAESYIWLGEVYLAQNWHIEAKVSFSEARGIYTSFRDDSGLMRSLDGLGGVCHAQSQYDEAERFFLEAEKICVRRDDDVGRAQVLNGLGAVRLAQHRYDDARICYDQALAIFDRIGNHLGRANALSGLGSVDHAQHRYEEAMELLIKAESIYKRIGNDVGLADALNGIATVHLKQCRYSEAKECYVQAREIHSRAGNHLGQAKSLSGLGSVDHAQCRYEGAMESFVESESIYKRIGNDAGLADVLDAIAAVHHKQYRYSDARECYFQALEIHNRFGNHLGQANSLSGFKNSARSPRGGEIMLVFFKVENILRRTGNDVGVARSWNAIAAVHFEDGRYPAAKQSCAQALDIYTNIGHDLGRANSLTGLGAVCYRQGDYGDAEESFRQASEIHKRIGREDEQAAALVRCGKVSTARGDYEEAKLAFLEAKKLLDTPAWFSWSLAPALVGLGDLCECQGKDEEALEFYRQAAEAESEWPGHSWWPTENDDPLRMRDRMKGLYSEAKWLEKCLGRV
ncbi:hypothetical protein FRC04_005126 [Tulasnella sp. 424]|nr:hypothetical protein FRC04_005126 [Tulasnella sp. 424]